MTGTRLLITLPLLAGGLVIVVGVNLACAAVSVPDDSVSPPLPACEMLTRRLAAKEQVIAALMEGHLTLFEAAARFRALDADPPGRTARHGLGSAAADEEEVCRQVIRWAEEGVRHGGDSRVPRRLERELAEHLRGSRMSVERPERPSGPESFKGD